MEMLVTALICLPFLWAILPAVIHNSKCRAFGSAFLLKGKMSAGSNRVLQCKTLFFADK